MPSASRRGFTDAITIAGKHKNAKASEGLDFCNRLYKLEHKWHDLDPEQRYEERLLHSKPLLEAFFVWLQETHEIAVPKSHLGRAVTYCLNQWKPLNTFLLDGRLPIDNNASERSIKAFVIPRKNFLFCNTPSGAKAGAITFSIVETAKENGLKPFDYIEYLLTTLTNTDLANLDPFMPWSEDLPERCRTLKKKIGKRPHNLHLRMRVFSLP